MSPQSPLGQAARDTLGRQLQSYSDACEALSVVEITLGFLSTGGGDPDLPLNKYVQDALHMVDQSPQVMEVRHPHPPTRGPRAHPGAVAGEGRQGWVREVLQHPLYPQALAACQLRHAIALWQFLAAHRSEQLLRLQRVSGTLLGVPGALPGLPGPAPADRSSPQEPFGDINPEYRKELSPKNAQLLRSFLNHTSLDSFLLELHDMMILKLKTLDWRPDWR